jgi:hypothetical protein
VSAGSFPVLPGLSDPGERIQSLTYRESYAPASLSTVYDPPTRLRLIEDAPALLRSAAAGAWALVSVAAAGAVLVVLVVLPGDVGCVTTRCE